jgi:hypothetical protein
MLTEAIEGENILLEDENQLRKLRSSLGLQTNSHQNVTDKHQPDITHLSTDSEVKNNRKKRRPGERKPKRDIVGGGENAG